MPTAKLTDAKLKSLKPRNKQFKIADGTIGGLHVAVSPTGKRVFRFSFRFGGKEQLLTIGPYPELSLADARDAALEAKKMVVQGKNPAAVKQKAKVASKTEKTTFHDVAEEWFTLRKPEWSEVHLKDTRQKMDLHMCPRLGHLPIATVTKADIKAVLDSLQCQGKFATLKKVRSTISQIFQYALDIELPGVIVDWTTQLKRQYSSPPVEHRAALTKPQEVGALIRAINAYEETSLLTALALKFSALTFCRPGEIRHAEWTEIDIANTLWRIPKEKMKAGQPHLVPLARQTLELLERLSPISCQSRFLFPSVRSPNRPMSEMTVTAALRRMGYDKQEMCAHGFRGMASTLLNEQGFRGDLIEKQLAHGPKDKIRAAYNHSDFLSDRRKMMEAWANYLDLLAMSLFIEKT